MWRQTPSEKNRSGLKQAKKQAPKYFGALPRRPDRTEHEFIYSRFLGRNLFVSAANINFPQVHIYQAINNGKYFAAAYRTNETAARSKCAIFCMTSYKSCNW
jgi:hypothetical protein